MSDVERRDVLIGTLGLATAALAATEPAAAGDTSFMNNVPDPLLSGDDLPTFKCNAKGGTPLMQSVQTIGIDLPLKKHWSRRMHRATRGFLTMTRVG